MGASESRPAFSYESQLLGDTASPQQMIEVDDPQQPQNASKPRRALIAKDGLVAVPYINEGNGGCPTIWDCFMRGVTKYGSRRCLGGRVYEVEGAKYKLAADKSIVRGAYVWETYEEIAEQSKDFGAGLVAIGAKQHDNIGIFSANRTEWLVTAFGLYSQNLRVIALYASLGENAVEFIINNGDVTMVCVSKKELPNLLKALPKTKGLTHIIQYDVNDKFNNVEDGISPADVETCKALNIELIGFNHVKKIGHEQNKVIFPNPAKGDDAAYIMYTSGTTGNPKGAVLKHSNIVATVAAVPYIFPLNENDQYLSYLPLAHIFETVVQTAILAAGGSIGFFQDNIKKLTDDMKDVQPTVFCGVPRVFNRIYQVVNAGVAEKNCIVKWYFNKAFNYQVDQVRQGLPLDKKYDAKVFKPLRERMGLGNTRLILTGAAPMPAFLHEFLKVVSGVAVIEGYGQTEASAATAVGLITDHHLAHCGPVVPSIEVRLEDIPEMGYLHTDANPRGEVCVRGPGVFAGYYKDEENTKASIIDGWLHTGDVGRFNPNGTLSIIDRKKNIMKLSQGEYVAVERVEQTYQKSPVVGQMWVYGNSLKSFLLAVVVPTVEPTAAWLYSKGWWPNADKESTKLAAETFIGDYVKAMEDPAHKAEIKAWVLAQLKEQEKPLTAFTRVKDIIVESGIDKLGMAFTEANDCMTPTFKMRRPQLLHRYIVQLKKLYAENGEPGEGEEKWPGEQ